MRILLRYYEDTIGLKRRIRFYKDTIGWKKYDTMMKPLRYYEDITTVLCEYLEGFGKP